MASLGIRCGRMYNQLTNQISQKPDPTRSCSLAIPNNRANPRRRISASASASATAAGGYLEPYVKGGEGICHEKMEEWMKDSVAEIVRNLREAPLLVQVYNNGRSKTEKAEDWEAVKGKWVAGVDPSPEGLIFVEELKEKSEEEEEEERDSTKAWGVVVQGKGGRSECGPPACYLLKTSQVRSSGSGMGGCFCTHFCLVKVKNFRETASSQLNNCWLLQ